MSNIKGRGIVMNVLAFTVGVLTLTSLAFTIGFMLTDEWDNSINLTDDIIRHTLSFLSWSIITTISSVVSMMHFYAIGNMTMVIMMTIVLIISIILLVTLYERINILNQK